MAVVIAAAALAIGAVLWTTSAVDSRTREAASLANATAATSQVQAGLREPLTFLLLGAGGFILSAEGLDDLPEAERARVLEIVSSGFVTTPASPGAVPEVSIPMPDGDAVALHRAIDLSSAQIDELTTGAGGVDLTGVVAQRDRLRASSEAYFENDSASNFTTLFSSVLSLGEELDSTQDRLSLGVAEAQIRLSQATSQARLVMLVALVSLTALMSLATFLIGRLIRRAFRASEIEREVLRSTSETLGYRNNQLNALYNVFSEITDTLSMRYVVSATLRETLRIMSGSMVVLRLLQDGELVPVGSLTSEGKELAHLPRVPLGKGPVGRAARRGRSVRIDQAALDQLGRTPSPGDADFLVESGIVAPLIVGARVVGTLAIWAQTRNAFTDEDEHVLEMMAFQVATAVVAADNAETSERRALHDSLTGLPNRRQLSEDIAREQGGLGDSGVGAVAMVDIDKFKSVNDEYGHRAGDTSLQKIAVVLRSVLRDGDMIYRYGGEEFVAIFKGASGQDAGRAAERLRQAVEEASIKEAKPLTVSIGVALMPDHGTDISQLIEKADRAMYRAKDMGRNRVQIWEEMRRSTDIATAA